MSLFEKLFRFRDSLKLVKEGSEIDFDMLYKAMDEYSRLVEVREQNAVLKNEIKELKKEIEMLLAELNKYNVGGGTIEEPQGTQLWSGDASSLENEANDVSTWSGFYNSVETTDTNGSTYAFKMTGGTNYRLANQTITGLTIGDSITISFDAKCNTQNQQNFGLDNTSNNDNFWLAGEQPLVWTSYSRTVTLQTDTFDFECIGSLGGGVNGDYILIDNLSIIKNAVAEPVEDNEAPTAPQNLQSSNVTDRAVTLSWEVSTDNIGVAGYNIYRNGIIITTSVSNSFTVTGLSSNTSYAFYVTAIDEASNESGQSNTVNITTSSYVPEPEGVYAFPSAYGAGANATGGRGGQIIHVNTLVWDAPLVNIDGVLYGGLKAAIQTQGARTIVFDVSGEIDATSEGAFAVLIFGASYDDLTIVGQTAPEGGITVKTSYFMFQDVDNVITRHVRFRNEGIVIQVGQSQYLPDAFKFLGGNDIIFDHCTFSHGLDQSATWGNTSGTMGNVTVQNCFFQDSKTGSILGVDEAGGDFTFINNVYSNISHRHPNPKGSGQYDIFNNVVYNWRSRLVRITHAGTYNICNNYYKPSVGGLRDNVWYGSGTIPATALQKLQMKTGNNPLIYTKGNVITGQRETPQADDSDMWVYFTESDAPYTPNQPVDSQFFTSSKFNLKGRQFGIKTAQQAYNETIVNGDVGAYKYLDNNGNVATYRDTKDAADLSMIINDTYSGSFYDDISSIPHPTVPENTRPVDFYVSNPHIPEAWFSANVPSGQDHNDIAPNGYTWFDNYVNQVDA